MNISTLTRKIENIRSMMMTNEKHNQTNNMLAIKICWINLSIIGVMAGWVGLWIKNIETQEVEKIISTENSTNLSQSLREVSSQDISQQVTLREVSQYKTQPRVYTRSSR